ncbi:MAG: alanine racemase [Oscillospiraceae bacterium]|nr:alanine racemase [Oscillospiraceae bacterium]
MNYLRRTWAEINLDALRHNALEIRKHTHPHTKLMGVVKADGYGHGAVAVAELLRELGYDMLGVSNINEALQLRRADIELPILILGYTPPEAAKQLLDNGLTQTVYSQGQALALSQACQAQQCTLPVHLKIDTGMSRLGFQHNEIEAILAVCNLPNLDIQGLFTHFSSGDDKAVTLAQLDRFCGTRKKLRDLGENFYVAHCANSAAVLQYPCTHFDMVRPGVILFGQSPVQQTINGWELQPVMSLHSIVSQVKCVAKGEGVSYDRKYVAPSDRLVATVPIGYADGYPRALSCRGSALINGKVAPLLGAVCMDMTMFDVTDIEDVCEGTEVVLFGKQGDAELSLSNVAQEVGTITYEIMCNVGKRVPRVYKQNGVEVGVTKNFVIDD